MQIEMPCFVLAKREINIEKKCQKYSNFENEKYQENTKFIIIFFFILDFLLVLNDKYFSFLIKFHGEFV